MRQGPCDISFQAEVGEGQVVIPRNVLNFCASRLALCPRTGPTYRAHKFDVGLWLKDCVTLQKLLTQKYVLQLCVARPPIIYNQKIRPWYRGIRTQIHRKQILKFPSYVSFTLVLLNRFGEFEFVLGLEIRKWKRIFERRIFCSNEESAHIWSRSLFLNAGLPDTEISDTSCFCMETDRIIYFG